MKTLHFFSDVYGPRLTGSPKLKAAGEWSVKQMKDWGFDKAEMEPWNWGNPGWESDRASGFITSPVKDTLVFEVLAWTPSTNGTVKSQPVQLEIPRIKTTEDGRCNRNPTQEELTAYFETNKAKINGKMVMIGNPSNPPVDFTPPAKRLDTEAINRRFNPSQIQFPQQQPCPKVEVKTLDFRDLADTIRQIFRWTTTFPFASTTRDANTDRFALSAIRHSIRPKLCRRSLCETKITDASGAC